MPPDFLTVFQGELLLATLPPTLPALTRSGNGEAVPGSSGALAAPADAAAAPKFNLATLQ